MSTVLVTGCSSGLGQLTALRFARQGHVVFAGVHVEGDAGPMADTAADEGLDVRVLVLDVGDAASVDAAGAAAGDVDVLVNIAVGELRGPIEACSDEEVRPFFDTHVVGLVRVVRAVLPGMRTRGSGVIVNVSSLAGLVARPFGGIHSAAKHAVEAISEALHHELRPFGIRVAVVEPGQFETGLPSPMAVASGFAEDSPYRAASDAFDAALRRLVPDGKPTPADVVADAIVGVAFDPSAGLRHLVGADAELVMSVRNSGDFEHFDKTLRAALDWDQ